MEKIDRRVERTRTLLQEALLSLVVERGYDGLRIEDITERANLRRATFYQHYKDKELLLVAALEDTFARLAAEAGHHASADNVGGKAQLEAYQLVFRHVDERHVLYARLLTGGSGALVGRLVRDFLAHIIMTGLAEEPSAALPAPAAVIAAYIAGAELALITWWLENERPYTADSMAQAAHALTLHGIASFARPTAQP